ncbi:MAG: CBS domain-containing protein [Hyphomicrobiales bacterium]|nr:CBS domain-containing protein [Hyphomicrobiales bacterium]
MYVEDIVGSQPDTVTCRPEDTIQTAAILLHTKFIGAMPVVDSAGMVVGMFGERDIVRAFASRKPNVADMLVRDLMSTKVISCPTGTTVLEAMDIMKRNRIRHVPVIDNGKLLGIVSIRDTLEELRQHAELEASVMRDISIAARAR